MGSRNKHKFLEHYYLFGKRIEHPNEYQQQYQTIVDLVNENDGPVHAKNYSNDMKLRKEKYLKVNSFRKILQKSFSTLKR